MSNLKEALKELAETLPDTIKIEVIEETGDTFKFVYPKPSESELSDVSLASIADGSPTNVSVSGSAFR